MFESLPYGAGIEATDRADVIAQVSALGYGLTCGIQTRINSRAQALAVAAHVGNIYINRNMIGAPVWRMAQLSQRHQP